MRFYTTGITFVVFYCWRHPDKVGMIPHRVAKCHLTPQLVHETRVVQIRIGGSLFFDEDELNKDAAWLPRSCRYFCFSMVVCPRAFTWLPLGVDAAGGGVSDKGDTDNFWRLAPLTVGVMNAEFECGFNLVAGFNQVLKALGVDDNAALRGVTDDA
ncbi:hypothetical protein FI667_g17606, partial [Globisporangium splendens]